MKKLSFALVIALICIFIISCEDKSIVNPQNEDFKITGISSLSSVSGSTVTLYGKNMDCGSLASIVIGGKGAEILSRSRDSIVAIVPPLPVGNYTLSSLSKEGTKQYFSKYDILKAEPLKITKISSTNGYVNSQVILYGENLNNGTYLEVKFGDKITDILQRTNDSIIVKVPKLAVGSYDIIVKAKLNTSAFKSKYEVETLDFSKFKNYYISGSSFQAEKNVYQEWRERLSSGENNSTEYDQNFCFYARNKEQIEIVETKTNSYQIEDEYHQKIDQITNYLEFIFNPNTNQFISISLDCKTYSKEYSEVNKVEIQKKFKFNLKNMDYTIDVTNKKLNIEIKGKDEISAKLLNFYYQWYYGNHSITENEYLTYNHTFKRFLWLNDKGIIRIQFSM
jgi:hypothetical protein